MSREALQADGEYPTGGVLVQIHDGEHHEIIADSAYDFVDEDSLDKKVTQGILYHGSLVVRNPVALAALQVT